MSRPRRIAGEVRLIPTLNDGEPSRPLAGRTAAARLGHVVAGSYRLVRFLAAGGSGDVYEAEHLRLGNAFAVKLLRLDGHTASAIRRFRREARAIAKVKSEHVVAIVDCGELEDDTPYLVMELLEGEDLRALLAREHDLPVRRAVQIVLEACSGLERVHAAGLVHRDIKPENLFITRRGSGEDWCKLLDFGVAKMDASQATAHGAIVGTVRYMAPEQLADSSQVSPATDIHALGLVLFECLSGRPAYLGQTVQELMYGVMNSEPPSLAALRPELPQSLVSVVTRCLAKSPSARPQSAEALRRLLSDFVGAAPSVEATLVEAQPPTTMTVSKPGRATRWWVLPIAATLLLVAASYLPVVRRVDTSPAAAVPPVAPSTSPPSPTLLLEPPTLPAAPAGSSNLSPSPSKPSTTGVPSAPSTPRVARPSPRETRQLGVGHFDRANPYEE